MGRIACLFVPDFPLAALSRAEPDLRGRPVAVADGADPRAPLLAVSREAERLGIRSGISVAQARAISGSVCIRQVTPEELHAADNALADVADSFSPRVEAPGGGLVFLDTDGLLSLFGSESHLATSLGAKSRRIGLEAEVGVASSRTVAFLAARAGGGVKVVARGAEREYLSPLPLRLLRPSAELAATLDRWGIRTLGDLAALPPGAVSRRLGEEGDSLWRRARGEDDTPLSPRSRALHFEEAADCEYAIDSFEPLSFLLRGALERLTARLEVRGLRAGDLGLSLRLEGGGREERTIEVGAPTGEVKVLLSLLRVHFESHPPRGAVEAFRIEAVPSRLRPIELDLFAPSGPAPDELHVTLARLAAIAGADRVGSPTIVDSHRPEVFVVECFEPWQRGAPTNGRSGSALALRAFRPPPPIEVVCDRGRPDFLQGEPQSGAPPVHGRAVTVAGPWRLHGEWWREAPLARDYYDVETTSGCTYRIYREHQTGRWYAYGVYD